MLTKLGRVIEFESGGSLVLFSIIIIAFFRVLVIIQIETVFCVVLVNAPLLDSGSENATLLSLVPTFLKRFPHFS